MTAEQEMPVLPAAQTEALVRKSRLSLPRQALVKNAKQLDQATSRMRYPLVLKIVSPKATHKTESGLLRLNIQNKQQLDHAFHDLTTRAKTLKIPIDDYLAQEQAKGVELFIGAKRDPSFGPVIAFGLGGILVELLHETALRIAPLSKHDAAAMIRETKAAKFLGNGFRGRKINETALVDALVKTSNLMVKNPKITELDFNPIICDEQKCTVVDARMVTQ